MSMLENIHMIEEVIEEPLADTSKYSHTDLIKAFCAGKRASLFDFAWWHDGVMHVGSGYYSYKDAVQMVDDAEREMIQHFKQPDNTY